MANAHLIDEIKRHVEEQCKKEENPFGTHIYREHISVVPVLALQLAQKTGADQEIVEISSWFHDIGSITGDYENHHMAGADYAERFLIERGYPQDRIAKVKHCIYAHRGSRSIPKETLESKCVADADALSCFSNIPSLFYLAYVTKRLKPEEGARFVKRKLEKAWNKISLKVTRDIAKARYKAAMLILSQDS